LGGCRERRAVQGRAISQLSQCFARLIRSRAAECALYIRFVLLKEVQERQQKLPFLGQERCEPGRIEGCASVGSVDNLVAPVHRLGSSDPRRSGSRRERPSTQAPPPISCDQPSTTDGTMSHGTPDLIRPLGVLRCFGATTRRPERERGSTSPRAGRMPGFQANRFNCQTRRRCESGRIPVPCRLES
jgi:hypothetical protein